jgi:DNA-binding NarL/FixJ family response regulator
MAGAAAVTNQLDAREPRAVAADGEAPPPARLCRVVIADDHEILRVGIRAFCKRVPELDVVGEAANGVELLKLVRQLAPDLVITDLVMPTMSGMEVIRHIHAEKPDLPVIVFSFHDEADYVMQVMGEGASAYLCKDCVGAELAHAVRQVLAGQPYVSSRVAGVVAHWLKSEQGRADDKFAPRQPSLSPREKMVLRMLVEEKPSKEIAGELGIAVSTVDVHRHKLMVKLGVKSLAGLIKYAVRQGMVEAPPA